MTVATFRAGMAAALGAALGNTTHAAAAGLGLAVLVTRWPAGLTAIRVAGAAFLCWLGIRSLLRATVLHDGRLSIAAEVGVVERLLGEL